MRLPLGRRLVGQGQRAVEKLFAALDLDGPGLLAGGAEGGVNAGQRAGVRCRGPLAAGRAAGFQRQHRLARCCQAQGIDKSRAAFDILKIEGDDVAVDHHRPAREDVGFVDISFVADAEQPAEANATADRPVDDAAAEGAALGEEGDVAARRHARDKGRVQRQMRVDDADAVGPHDAHAIAPGDLDDLFLDGNALAADLAESAGDDHGRLDAALAAGLDDRRHGRRRNDDDCQLDWIRHGADVRVAAHAQNLIGLGIDRVDGAGVGMGGSSKLRMTP